MILADVCLLLPPTFVKQESASWGLPHVGQGILCKARWGTNLRPSLLGRIKVRGWGGVRESAGGSSGDHGGLR